MAPATATVTSEGGLPATELVKSMDMAFLRVLVADVEGKGMRLRAAVVVDHLVVVAVVEMLDVLIHCVLGLGCKCVCVCV